MKPSFLPRIRISVAASSTMIACIVALVAIAAVLPATVWAAPRQNGESGNGVKVRLCTAGRASLAVSSNGSGQRCTLSVDAQPAAVRRAPNGVGVRMGAAALVPGAASQPPGTEPPALELF